MEERWYYETSDGRKIVLVVGYYRSFKSHWIEDAETGRILTKHYFYNEASIAEIKLTATKGNTCMLIMNKLS